MVSDTVFPGPTDLPGPIPITDVRRQGDPGPTVWPPFDPAKTEAQSGIFNRGFVDERSCHVRLIPFASFRNRFRGAGDVDLRT